MVIKVWIKTLLARITTVIEFCKDCGARQPIVWHATDDLWDRISGDKNVLCPNCFDKRADQKGILLMWTPKAEYER